MSRNKAQEERLDAFGSAPAESAVDYMYGAGDLGSPPTNLPMMTQQIKLMDIVPDITQPRRAIPQSVRGGWDGNPMEIPSLLEVWKMRAQREIDVDLEQVIREERREIDGEEGAELFASLPDDLSPMAKGFVELAQLAADIKREGLTNPITVARQERGFVIIAGERRYLAHHLLMEYADGADTIQCIVKPARNVWVQASENANRSPLNAIGMARQVALLIMAMYEEQRGEAFVPYQEIVEPGESDRTFYAQVADGRQYRVLEGYAEKLTTATGLPSYRQVRRYRALLTIPDELWVQADNDDLAEYAIRTMVNPPKQSQSAPTGALSDEESFEQVPSPPTPLPRGEGRMIQENTRITDDDGYGEDAWEHARVPAVKRDADEVDYGADVPDYLLTPDQDRLIGLIWQFVQHHERDEDAVYEGDVPVWRWDVEFLQASAVELRALDENSLPRPQEVKKFKQGVYMRLRELSFALDEMRQGLIDIGEHLNKLADEHVRDARK